MLHLFLKPPDLSYNTTYSALLVCTYVADYAQHRVNHRVLQFRNPGLDLLNVILGCCDAKTEGSADSLPCPAAESPSGLCVVAFFFDYMHLVTCVFLDAAGRGILPAGHLQSHRSCLHCILPPLPSRMPKHEGHSQRKAPPKNLAAYCNNDGAKS